jgi:DNA integrity scanning protein DisA with diadenylate cyclase activity
MINEMLFLDSFYSYKGTIGKIFDSWENAGFFAYLFPFLLIFSISFILITRLKAFEKNKSVSGIIAVVVSLMAIQLDFVPSFFSEIFPRLGVGLAVILVLLILIGAFIDPKKGYFTWILFGIGAVIFLIILGQSFNQYEYDFFSSYFWSEYGVAIIGVIIVLIIIGIVVGSGKKSSKTNETKALIFGEDE